MPSKWFLNCLLATLTLHQGSEASPLAGERVKRQSDTLSSGIRRPPQAPHVFNETADSINKTVQAYIDAEKLFLDALVASTTAENATFDNLALQLAYHEADGNVLLNYFQTFTYYHPNKDIRDAGDAISGPLQDLDQARNTRQDLYDLLNAVYGRQENDTNLDLESRLFLKSYRKDLTSNGLGIEAGPKRDRFLELQDRITLLQTEYQANLTNDRKIVWFTLDELPGVKPETLEQLINGTDENAGKLGADVSAPYSGDIAQYCSNSTTRRELFIQYYLLAPNNTALLNETLALRDELARLAGYPNFAAYKIEDQMAKTPQAVADLQTKYGNIMTPKVVKENDAVRQRMAKDGVDASILYDWDMGYYQTKMVDESGALPLDRIKEYFPAAQTVHAVLALYAQLFGIEFVEITGKDLDELSPTGNGTELLWHPDVVLYAVWDNSTCSDGDQPSPASSEFIGYLYIDIFYRDGKQDGAFMAPMEPGFIDRNGDRHYPTAGLFTNFQKAAENATRPSLMERSEVESLMHEAGHGMHQLLCKTRFARFHGPNGTPNDWLEMPSQLMEEFSYSPAVLRRLSQHYTATDSRWADAWRKTNGTDLPPVTIPDEVITQIINTRHSFSGGSEIFQVAVGQVDQAYHTPQTHEDALHLNSTAIWNDLFTNLTQHEGWGDSGAHGQTTVTHWMMGYEARYYAYLWSRVYAIDVFYTAFKDDPFSAAAGTRWRTEVLQIGGASDDLQGVLDNFLGHKAPDYGPILDAYGVNSDSGTPSA